MPFAKLKSLRFLGWPLLCGTLAGLLIVQLRQPEPSAIATPAATPAATIDAPYSYADAVAHAAPAVVNIYTAKTVRVTVNPLLNDPLMQRFFGRRSPQQERVQRSLGSGVIVDARGYLLTNDHVIRGADQILVALHDGREALAKVVGSDPETDLAVLKIDLDDLSPIEVGTASKARVGDVVLAIGNPYGFGQSVSQGIISATGRYGLQLATYESYLQTDAAINPGNSGGALIDARGALLGINTAIYSQSGGSSGIGLAIPAEIAVRTMKDLIEYGHPVRGWLGIEVTRVPAEVIAANDLAPGNGIVITQITHGGPAQRAGLKQADIIVAINGQPVGDGHAGMNIIGETRPGDQVMIEVIRDGEREKFAVTVGTRPAVEKNARE
jgi:serine protease DegS